MNRRSFVVSLLFIFAIVYAVWQIKFHGIHPKLIFSPPPPEPAPVAVLDEVVSLHFEDTLLSDVLDQISKEHSVPIRFQNPINGPLPSSKVESFRVEGVTLRAALRLLVHPYLGPDAVVEGDGGTIILADVMGWNDTLSNLTTKLYPLTDVLAGGLQITEQQLVDVISLLDNFEGGTGEITATPGGLIVLQTADKHRQIQRLLEHLSCLDEYHDSAEPIILDNASLENRRRIVAELSKPTEIVIAGKTRKQICDELSKKHGIPIIFVPGGKFPDATMNELYTPVEAHIVAPHWQSLFISSRWHDISLQSALHLLCESDDYAMDIRDGAVVIAPEEEIEQRLSLRVYPLVGLKPKANGKDWIELVERTAAPGMWVSVGGPGESVYAFGMLFVLQSDPAHRSVAETLRQLRHASHPGASYQEFLTLGYPRTEFETRIERALKTHVERNDPTTLQFLRGIAKKHGINFWIDPCVASFYGPGTISRLDSPPIESHARERDSLGRAENDPFAVGENSSDADDNDPMANVVAKLMPKKKVPQWHSTFPTHGDGVPLEVALQRALRQFKLTFVVEHESIVVSMPHEAEANLITKLYSIKPFFSYAHTSDLREYIVDLIVALVEPRMWEDHGGPGTIELYGSDLVIAQTREVHSQIATLMRRLGRQLAGSHQTAQATTAICLDDGNVNVERVLDQRCELIVEGKTLRSFAEWIEREYRIPVDFNMDYIGGDLDDPLPDSRIFASLRAGINSVLAQVGLTAFVSRGSLWITPPEEASEETWPARIYGIEDLVNTTYNQGEIDVARAIERCLAQNSLVIPLPGMLVVPETYDGHQSIQRFLQGLRQVSSGDGKRGQPSQLDFGEVSLGAEDRVAEAFRKPIGVTCEQLPIDSAMQKISSRHRLAIELLADGYDPDEQITITSDMAKRPLGEMLRRIANERNLSLAIDDSIVFITDRTAPRPIPEVRFYNVSDLMEEVTLDEQLTLQFRQSSPTRQTEHYFFGGYKDVLRFGRSRVARSRLEAVLDLLFQQTRFWPNPQGDFAIIGNALAVSGTSSIYSHLQWMIRQLRSRMVSAAARRYMSPTNQIVTSPSSSADLKARVVKVYDVRPILKRISGLNATKLIEMVKSVVAPASWLPLKSQTAADGQRVKVSTRGGDIEHFHHHLVVSHSALIHDQLNELLKLLDDPENVTFFAEQATAENVIDLCIETKGRNQKLLYTFWLSQVRPSKAGAEYVVGELAKIDPESNTDDFLLLLRVATSYGDWAKGAVPIVKAVLEDSHLTYRHDFLVALGKLGPSGIDVICEKLKTAGGNERLELRVALMELGESANRATPTVVKMYDDVSDNEIKEILQAIDPDLETTTRFIKENYRRNHEDPSSIDAKMFELLDYLQYFIP